MLHNQLLLEYKGETFNEKTKFDIDKYLKENRIKELKYENKLLPMALVCVQEDKEIKSLGASVPNDLINNNWGEFWAAMLKPFAFGSTFFPVTNIGGLAETIRAWAGGTTDVYNISSSYAMQVGQGTTAPTRSDFKIETAFTNGGAEDGLVGFANAGYNPALGQTKESVVFTTAGSGIISETIRTHRGENSVGVFKTWILTRDLISPTASFIGGQQVFVEYTWQI